MQRGKLHSLEHCEEDMFLPSIAQDTSKSEETFVHAGRKLQKIFHGMKKRDKVRKAWSIAPTQMGGCQWEPRPRASLCTGTNEAEDSWEGCVSTSAQL